MLFATDIPSAAVSAKLLLVCETFAAGDSGSWLDSEKIAAVSGVYRDELCRLKMEQTQSDKLHFVALGPATVDW